MAEVAMNITGGQCDAVPIRRAGGTIDFRPRPQRKLKVDKVDDTLIKNIRTEALAVRYYEELGCSDEADQTRDNIVKLAFMLAGIEG